MLPRETENLNTSPRMLKELADAYGVDAKTFKSWLKCETLKHIKPDGYYYSIKQVNEIINHLGKP